MEYPLAFRDERLALARFVVALLQELHTSLFPARAGDVGRQADAVLVACCVTIGHADGRPVNATKVAHMLGIPRMTAARRLGELAESGAITRRGRAYFVSEARMRGVTALDLRRVARLCRGISEALERSPAV